MGRKLMEEEEARQTEKEVERDCLKEDCREKGLSGEAEDSFMDTRKKQQLQMNVGTAEEEVAYTEPYSISIS